MNAAVLAFSLLQPVSSFKRNWEQLQSPRTSQIIKAPRVKLVWYSPPHVRIEPEGVDPGLFFVNPDVALEDYRLGPDDVVEIRVFELEQLNRTVRVSGDGQIDLPLTGALTIRGLTSEQVADLIAEKLEERFVQGPQVTVFIHEFNSQKVSLLGAVKQVDSYSLLGIRTLLELLAEAGGLSADAGTLLYLFRQSADGVTARLTIPLNQLLVGGDPRWNIRLRAGDIVSVPPDAAVGVSILGPVRGPGLYKLPSEGATLLRAIALAGGLGERASQNIRIRRENATGKELILSVDFGDILSGKRPDVVLQEGDVIIVKESFF